MQGVVVVRLGGVVHDGIYCAHQLVDKNLIRNIPVDEFHSSARQFGQ